MTAYGISARSAADLAVNPQFLAMIGHDADGDVRRARQAAGAMLRGEGDAQRDLSRHVSERQYPLPPGFEPLLRGLGIDPTAATALMDMVAAPGLSILADVTNETGYRLCGLSSTGQDTMWVTLDGSSGGPSSWRRTEMIVPVVPEAVRTRLVGRPLRELLSHPVLDRMDIGIVDFFECVESPSTIEVVTTLHPDPY